MRGDVKRIDANSEVYSAQIDRLYHQTPLVLTVNVVNSALVALVLASYLGQTPWLIFLVLTLALTALRLIGWNRYYSRSHSGGEATARYATLAIVGSGLSGILWGAGSALLLPDNLVEQTCCVAHGGDAEISSGGLDNVFFDGQSPKVAQAVLPDEERISERERDTSMLSNLTQGVYL